MQTIQPVPASSWTGLLVICTIASTGVSSCSATRIQKSAESPQTSIESLQGKINPDLNQSNSAAEFVSQSISMATDTPQRRQTQLIKTADLTLQVEDVNITLSKIRVLLNQQQGDLLKLDNQTPRRKGDRETYRIEIRIPQANFDPTLDALEKFGSIRQRSIQAQDVSEQLVDAQARLKNLRTSEETVLKIMERSGSIADVLSASQELSNIRENIERIDAQFQRLKTQVAFSTINLNLQAEAGFTSPVTSTGKQIQNAWTTSTEAMGNLTIAFLKLGIWGIAFGPYVIALGSIIWLSKKQMAKSRLQAKTIETDAASPS